MNQTQALERALLGSLLPKASLIEASDLTARDFSDGLHRRTFELIIQLREDTKSEEIDAVILAQRLGGNGAGEFVGSLMNGRVRLDPDIFLRRVLELRRMKLRRRALGNLTAALTTEEKTGEVDPEEWDRLRDTFRRIDELDGASRIVDPLQSLKSGADLQALEINVEYLVDGLLPANAVTVLFGKGGIGKTWAALSLAKAIRAGAPFYGRSTQARPVVYVDFENPLSVLIERARKLDVRDVLFWHGAFEPRPPKLDSDEYQLFKKLPAGSVLIFDTLRSSHNLDENDSRDMSFVMGRLKELRDAGLTPLCQHHTPKANERGAKGSTAITDLADHVLSLYNCRRGTFDAREDDNEPTGDATFRLGTGEKTRFKPDQIFLRRSAEGSFVLAEDPDQEYLAPLAEYIRSQIVPPNQSEIVAWARQGLDIKKRDKVLSLLRKGDGILWRTRPEGVRKLYVRI